VAQKKDNINQSISRKKIALVNYFLSVNGPGHIRLALAKELLAQGYDVDFVINNSDGELTKFIPSECKIYELGASRPRDFILKLGKYLRKEKPNAVLASSWPYTAATILAVKLFGRNIRVVVSEHVDFRTNFYASKEFTKKDIFLIKYLGKYIYGFADKVVGVSSGVIEGIIEITGLSQKKTMVINNPLRIFNRTNSFYDEIAIKNSFWQPGTKKILAVGRLTYQKSFEILIEAIGLILNRESIKLIIIGDGALRDELRAVTEYHGLFENILFAGSLANLDVFYSEADLFVMSSSSEGFGNVIVEALSFGVPVVSPECKSGPSEILGNGKWGTLVPVGDAAALAKGIEESLSREHDRVLLKQRANDFSPSVIASQYIKAFDF
jgi:glycosyltransferase involved in cell wall biosynthesis